MNQRTSIMDRLRHETRHEHTRVEELPFFSALDASELPIASYIGFLQTLETVYDVFEQEMQQSSDTRIGAVWDDSLCKLPLIQRDLTHLQPQMDTTRRMGHASLAAVRAQLLAQCIRQRAYSDPVSLLGYLYVFEGSTFGALILQEQVARSFGLTPATGLAFLSNYQRSTKAHWTEFTRRMNQLPLDAAAQEAVVEAAREAFAGLAQIIAALYPLETSSPRILLRTLNQEAGSHAMPTDMREVQAALRAGERSWRNFPYYAWRYGERGERFTRSDSAWLVTLARYDVASAVQEVLWLGEILSARGMPQWLLERHLYYLHEELADAVPAKQAEYVTLQHAADFLREQRQQHIHPDLFDALDDAFAQEVGDEWNRRLPHTGGLLAAAVADEQTGITRAVPSIESWMTDPDRFPPRWIDAVCRTIQAARVGAE